jgi:hypothetical protein
MEAQTLLLHPYKADLALQAVLNSYSGLRLLLLVHRTPQLELELDFNPGMMLFAVRQG